MPTKKTMKQLRKALDLTQQELADKAQIGVATIIRCEADDRWPVNHAVRKAVQMALGVQS